MTHTYNRLSFGDHFLRCLEVPTAQLSNQRVSLLLLEGDLEIRPVKEPILTEGQ